MILSDLSEFLFNLPLYSERELDKDGNLIEVLTAYHSEVSDGHCPYCQKQSTFIFDQQIIPNALLGNQNRMLLLKQRFGLRDLVVSCARKPTHRLRYWYLLRDFRVTKVGQLPSLADIANDEAANYRSVLNKDDSGELHKAIGLAAHGVGIGSFVYLRRIFERLIQRRFEEFRELEGWDAEEFKKLRMNDKVSYLKDHLPAFLVENSRLYGVLSKGIHELSEEICLQAFDPVKLSIKIILEEDKRKQDELELRKQAAAAIAKFEH